MLGAFLSSLRGRIFLASALLVVLAIGGALYLVNVQFTRQAEETLQRETVTASAIVDDLRDTRIQTFTQMARFIADAPKMKAAVDTNDPPTVQDIASQYQDQLRSNVLLVTNRTGGVLATVGPIPGAPLVDAIAPAIAEARVGRERFSLLARPDGVLQLVTVPITIGLEQPEILGTVSVGFLFDSALAGQLKGITGSDVAFGLDGRVLAATLPRDTFDVLGTRLGTGGISRLSLNGEDFLVLPRPLTADGTAPEGGGVPVALILRSRTELLRGLQTIHAGLAATALVSVILATILGFAVAGTITRPLADITDVMREVAATGDLTRRIPVQDSRWRDADARLLASTFNTLTESIARFQRESSQKERLTSLGRLSTVIAHEIRNPLMIIKAALHTLRQDAGTEAAMREAIADIDDEVVRLNRIVHEVLDFSRPIRFELAPADLGALCRESAAAAAASPGPPVELDLAADLPAIDTDAARLRIALVNLLENARHASTGPVTLRASAADGRVRLVVSDRGSGIAPADLQQVFDPYFTTRRGGTGLGLPIAKNIVEGLGGALAVASTVGRGTEVTIELPARAAAAAGSAD